MISANIPVNESARLQALYDYHILDTESEKVFDDLTQLASQICGTPIALISLIDPDRQWFKSKVGLDASETSRDIAFCAHAILEENIFEVPDTLQDKRFFDNPLVTQDPNIRFYAGTQLVTPEGQAIGTLCAISDQPMKLSEHQKNALEILGRQVISQLELRKTIQQVELANQRKTEFLSNVSHELRTPLNAIIGFCGLMLNDSELTLPDKHLAYLKNMHFSGNQLLTLVNSLLDLSKIEAGKMELKPSLIESAAFFKSLVAMIQANESNHGVTINLALPENMPQSLFADHTRLSQIILNIASNAVKFSRPGQQVDILINYQQQMLNIEVVDYGEGIAKQDIAKLFSSFQQVGMQNNKVGSGLGLMISKRLVELMEGNIKLSSELGKGTQISLSIPASEHAPENTEATPTDMQVVANFRTNCSILVVEDHEINQIVADAIFASIGLSVIFADSGEDALERVKHEQFDIIFMDLHLPGIDGFETANIILQQNPEQTIVALSADVFAEKQLLDKGMKCSITKPIHVDSIIRVLNQFVPI